MKKKNDEGRETVATVSATGKPIGRPKLPKGQLKVKRSVSLSPKVIEFLKRQGDSNVSVGIERTVDDLREARQKLRKLQSR